MRRKLRYGLLLLALALVPGLKAQQLPLYSQYLLNGFMVNPAMAGYDGYTTVNATSRQQWLGFAEAPRTYSASWQTRLFRKGYQIVNKSFGRGNRLIPSTKGRVGLGAYVINDINAKVARTGFSFTYAYHIIINDDQLSFGLAAKGFQYRLDADALTYREDGDPVASRGGKQTGYSPDADFGVLWNGSNYFAGVSVSNLLQSALVVGGGKLPDYKTYRHYWLTAGYRFQINYDWAIEPSTLLKTSENWNPQGDLTMRVYWADILWMGASYRTNNSVIGMVGVQVDNVFFGYAFDWSFSEIGNYTFGSHEITLAVKMGDGSRKSRSQIRY